MKKLDNSQVHTIYKYPAFDHFVDINKTIMVPKGE